MLIVSTSEHYWWLTGDPRGFRVRWAEGREATPEDLKESAYTVRHHERAYGLPPFPLPISEAEEAEIKERVRIFFEEPEKLPPLSPEWANPGEFAFASLGEWPTASSAGRPSTAAT